MATLKLLAVSLEDAAAMLTPDGVLDVNVVDLDGMTLLHHAAHSWMPSADSNIARLAEAGADVNRGDKQGKTPLMLAQRLDARAAILKLSPNVDAADGEGNTALLHAVLGYGNVDGAIKQLADAGANLDLQNRQGKTALMLCARNSQYVGRLVKAGAQIDLVDHDGRSALALADPDSIRVLIHANAKFNLFENEPLIRALEQGDLPLAIMLFERGARISTAQDGFRRLKTSLEKIARSKPSLLQSGVQCLDSETTEAFARLIAVHSSSIEVARYEELPATLRRETWLSPEANRKPIAITADRFAAIAPGAGTLRWLEGECEEALPIHRRASRSATPDSQGATHDDAKLVEKLAKFRKKKYPMKFVTLVKASDPLLLEVWNQHAAKLSRQFVFDTWRGLESKDIRYLLARLGIAALPGCVGAAQQIPKLIAALRLADSPSCAPLMSVLMVDGAEARMARQWMLTYPNSAGLGLLPIALGKPSKKRDMAEAGLRFLAFHGHRGLIEAVAAALGADVSSALAELLALDPRCDFLPKNLPVMPVFWRADIYPAPRLKLSGRSLPPDAIDILVRLMSGAGVDVQTLAIDEVLQACDRKSLAEFAWAVFEDWAVKGDKASDWRFSSLAYFGDDLCARKLTPYVREWARSSSTLRATKGLAIMAAIGGDVALTQIQSIALKNKCKPVLECAQQMMQAIARDRSLSTEELEDRLVPTLGLSDAGTFEIDYGSRRFTGSVDVALKPVLRDPSGSLVKTLPSPGKSDDKGRADAQVAVWAALCRELKPTAKLQLERFERAMVDSRRWSGKDFKSLLATHPLLQALIRGLVWGVFQKRSVLAATFRAMPDGGLVDVNGADVKLANSARVGVVHPLLFQPLLEDWKNAFARDRPAQPFAQLARKVYREQDDTEGNRFGLEGALVPSRALKGLTAMGWHWEFGDVGWIDSFERSFASGSVSIQVRPGVPITNFEEGGFEEQTLTIRQWGKLNEFEFSELTRELLTLRK